MISITSWLEKCVVKGDKDMKRYKAFDSDMSCKDFIYEIGKEYCVDYNIKSPSSENHSKLTASGNYSKLVSSGYYSNLAASGNHSKLASSENNSKLAASGDNSIVASVGNNSKAKVGDNGLIVLTYYSESERRNKASIAYVGENGIKKNTWYTLDSNGKLVEALEI